MLDWLARWDLALYRHINLTHTSPALDPLMWLASWGPSGAILFMLAVAAASLRKSRYGLRVLTVVAAVFLVSDVLGSQVLKPLMARVRPCHHQMDARRMNDICGSTYGMPSGHAANTMGVATVLYFYAPPAAAAIAFVTSLIVGYSRIYVGVHYPGDVFAGWIVGILFGVIVSLAMRRWVHQGSRKWK